MKTCTAQQCIPGQLYKFDFVTHARCLYKTTTCLRVKERIGFLSNTDEFCFLRIAASGRRTTTTDFHIIEILTCTERPVIGYTLIHDDDVFLLSEIPEK